MQRLPEGYSALNHRLEHPAPDQHAEGDEIVHARAKALGNVNPLVPGSNPGGPTTTPHQTALCGIAKAHYFAGFPRASLDATRWVNRSFWPKIRQNLALSLRSIGLQDCQVKAIVFRFPCRSTVYAWTRESDFIASMLVRRDVND